MQKQSQLDAEEIQKVKDMFEKVKKALIDKIEKIKNNKELIFLIRLSQDKEMKKYMSMYKKVKTKRLRKKYKNKIDKRIDYIKLNAGEFK